MSEENILKNLNNEQKKAVQTTEGPLLILAGAGSGKTRTIVHRISYLIHEKKVSPWRIIAVTFTNKAAGEMLDRTLKVAGPEASDCLIRTYHSLGLFLLRRYVQYIDYPPDFTIWDDTDRFGILQSILTNSFKEKLNKTEIKYISQCISSFKDSLISPLQLKEDVDLDIYEFADILPDVYQQYEVQKTNSRAMDFADLLYQNVKILQEKPELLEKVQNRYDYFLIDEYQDTNLAQNMLLKLLSQKSQNLCVVGDDDQAIYGWRGADVKNILEFSKNFPGTKIIKLEENYRSTQQILDLSNSIIKNNLERMGKELWTKKKDGSLPYLYVFNDDKEEAFSIANLIKNISAKVSLSEIAVLYRTNAHSRLVEEALLKLNIPYQVYGGVAFFGRKEVKDVLAYLKFLVNPNDEIAFLRIVNTPPRGIGEKSIQKIYEYREKLIREKRVSVNFISLLKEIDRMFLSSKVANSLKKLLIWLDNLGNEVTENTDLIDLLERVLDRSGLRKHYEEEDKLLGTRRLENLAELNNSISSFNQKNPKALLPDYLQEMALFTGGEDLLEVKESVNLMTVHNAKGLEFDTVFILGLDEGVFPHFLSKRDGNHEEERRLFYVAITRARNKLYLTRARKRFHQGWYQKASPSTFLEKIPDKLLEGKISGNLKKFSIELNKNKDKEKFKNIIFTDFSNQKQFYKLGDQVAHPSFGKGEVVKLEGSSKTEKISILFEDNITRKFLLKFTKLKKL